MSAASTKFISSTGTPRKSGSDSVALASSRSEAVLDPNYRPILDSKPFTKGDPITLLQCMTHREDLATCVEKVRTALCSEENKQKGEKWKKEWTQFETKKAEEKAAVKKQKISFEPKDGTPIAWMNDMITMVLCFTDP